MKPRYIIFWHGVTPKIEEKIKEICGDKMEFADSYFYSGSIDNFIDKWLGGPIMVTDQWIAVTQYGRFDAR